jgi:hypothetical protein|nr:MAG TPA: hypothetical protein [Caudoviricetes sp.]
MKFYHKDGRVLEVKERTKKQIWKVLKRYLHPEELQSLEYIGNQHISVNNGNIYADFYDHRYKAADGTPHKTTLYIADYSDYIGEIKNG